VPDWGTEARAGLQTCTAGARRPGPGCRPAPSESFGLPAPPPASERQERAEAEQAQGRRLRDNVGGSGSGREADVVELDFNVLSATFRIGPEAEEAREWP